MDMKAVYLDQELFERISDDKEVSQTVTIAHYLKGDYFIGTPLSIMNKSDLNGTGLLGVITSVSFFNKNDSTNDLIVNFTIKKSSLGANTL